MSNIMQTRVSKGSPGTIWDGTSCCPFVQGQKKILVLLSLFSPRTKKCQNKSKMSKNVKKCQTKYIFLLFFPFCLMAILGCFETGQNRLLKSRPSLSRGKISKSCPGPFRVKILCLSCCPRTMNELLSHCPFVQRQ